MKLLVGTCKWYLQLRMVVVYYAVPFTMPASSCSDPCKIKVCAFHHAQQPGPYKDSSSEFPPVGDEIDTG